MSIKTIENQTQSNSKGLEKEINVGAKRLIFDVLQSTQYSTPIPSTIRELVTNACDSQREKEIAIEILTGAKKVEDYYISRDGEAYSDSNFDPSYYSLEHFSPKDVIEIRYTTDDEGTGYCDTVNIIDYGVGIGGKRLEGITQLGFSTKRNTAENFGAFGLGSKVALSTGVPYYTITSVHNGKRVVMNCYPYKTEFVGDKFTSDGYVELSNGIKAYYTNTDQLNYTKVSFKVKRYNRNTFKESVVQQLNYLSNVDFYINDDKIYTSDHQLLNTDNIIVGFDSYYAKPHIVIVKHPGDVTGINYGAIDFNELELEDMRGNVGIKCPIRQSYIDDEGREVVIQDGVEVTPSREKVIWNEHTKEYLLNMIEKASEDCARIIDETLTESDLVTWIKLCSAVLFKSGNAWKDVPNGSVIYQIARMIDPSKIRPTFNGIKFQAPILMFEDLQVRRIRKQSTRRGKIEINRDEVVSWGDVDFENFYVSQASSANYYVDMYLLQNTTSFYLISPRTESVDSMILEFLSSPDIKKYDEIAVPKVYKDSLDKRAEVESVDKTDLKTLRKLNAEIVGHTLRIGRLSKKFIWDKLTLKITNVLDSEVVTYYGNLDSDGYKLKLAAMYLYRSLPRFNVGVNNWSDYYCRPVYFHQAFAPSVSAQFYENLNSVQLIGFAQGNMKYPEANKNWKHIDEFFFEREDDNLVLGEHIKKSLTAHSLSDLENHSWIAAGYYKTPSVVYSALDSYRNKYKFYSSENRDNRIFKFGMEDEDYEKALELKTYIDKFAEYHEICQTDDIELINLKSFELFVVSLGKMDILNEDVLNAYKAIQEFSEGEFKEFFRIANPSFHQSCIPTYDVIAKYYGKDLVEFPDVDSFYNKP